MTQKNEIILGLGIWGFDDITHDEITNLIGVQPVKVHIKGEKINPNLLLIAKKNGWIINSPHDKYTPFEEQMNSLLDIIESKFELFKSFSTKYRCIFSCALFIYIDTEESTPPVHLGPRYNAVLKGINIEFDVDIYLVQG